MAAETAAAVGTVAVGTVAAETTAAETVAAAAMAAVGTAAEAMEAATAVEATAAATEAARSQQPLPRRFPETPVDAASQPRGRQGTPASSRRRSTELRAAPCWRSTDCRPR